MKISTFFQPDENNPGKHGIYISLDDNKAIGESWTLDEIEQLEYNLFDILIKLRIYRTACEKL